MEEYSLIRKAISMVSYSFWQEFIDHAHSLTVYALLETSHINFCAVGVIINIISTPCITVLLYAQLPSAFYCFLMYMYNVDL